MLINSSSIFCFVLLLAAPLLARAGQPPFFLTPAQCEALARADLSRVEDAPGKIMTAKAFAAVDEVPAYCEVIGYVWHDVEFRVRLPMSRWNGKLVVLGTGGQAGDFMPDDPRTADSESRSALSRGFATAAHNGGHLSTRTDAQWAYQNESALLDYAFRAPHVAGLAARAVVIQTFGRAARHVYYSGCSNGGREALQMAQRYPYDYDGIIAGAPSMRWSDLFLNLYWFTNRMYGSDAVLDSGALRILHRYVLDRCDRLDGKLDGILDDPRKCQVDLEPITCTNSRVTNCLTPAQAQAAREIYDGPRDKAGHPVARSSAMPGSELVWAEFRSIEGYPESVLRFQTFMPASGPTFMPDEARLAEYSRRSGGSDAILSATNPDLRQFRDNGGKLLSYMGWNDPVGGIRETIDYYSMVQRVMGGREATQGFYRLFMVPGMNHCSGGEGASRIDWLGALDAWVENRKPPDTISGFHPDARSKPMFFRTIAPLSVDSEH